MSPLRAFHETPSHLCSVLQARATILHIRRERAADKWDEAQETFHAVRCGAAPTVCLRALLPR